MSALFSGWETCKNSRHLPEPGVRQLLAGLHPLPFLKAADCHVLQVDYRKYVAVNLATSHPHYDAAGNVLNVGRGQRIRKMRVYSQQREDPRKGAK